LFSALRGPGLADAAGLWLSLSTSIRTTLYVVICNCLLFYFHQYLAAGNVLHVDFSQGRRVPLHMDGVTDLDRNVQSWSHQRREIDHPERTAITRTPIRVSFSQLLRITATLESSTLPSQPQFAGKIRHSTLAAS
jgi:hypothetical protein